jgi:hypothetical protein
MANFDSGVKKYIIAQAVVTVGFPVDWNERPDIACKHCQFYVRSTQRCALTQDVLNFPDRYVGANCPLEEITEEQGEQNG